MSYDRTFNIGDEVYVLIYTSFQTLRYKDTFTVVKDKITGILFLESGVSYMLTDEMDEDLEFTDFMPADNLYHTKAEAISAGEKMVAESERKKRVL